MAEMIVALPGWQATHYTVADENLGLSDIGTRLIEVTLFFSNIGFNTDIFLTVSTV